MTFEAFGQTYEADSMEQANREFLWDIEDFHYDSDGYWHQLNEDAYVWLSGNFFD